MACAACSEAAATTLMLDMHTTNHTVASTATYVGPMWFGAGASLVISNVGSASKPLELRGPLVFSNRSSLIVFNSYVVVVQGDTTITLLDEARADVFYSELRFSSGIAQLLACSWSQFRLKDSVLARNATLSNGIELWQFGRSIVVVENVFGSTGGQGPFVVDWHVEVS